MYEEEYFETLVSSFDQIEKNRNLQGNFSLFYGFGIGIGGNCVHVDDSNFAKSRSVDRARQLFTASCCSVLFLRLICPALIDPAQWWYVFDSDSK